MNLQELRDQQARIVTNARAKLEEITDETTEARAKEIETEFDTAMADYDATVAKIERMEKLELAEERANRDYRRPQDGQGEVRGDAGERPDYKEVFKRAIAYGVSELSAAEAAVLREHRAELPDELRAQTSTTGSSGGFTVPTEFSGEIDKAMAAWGPLWDASIVRELATSNGRRIEWPTVDDTANTGRIKAQNSPVDDDGTDDVTFAQKLLDAYVYDTGMVRIPLELLQDSYFNIEGLMNELFGERLGRLANSVLTTGGGSSVPQGIVPAAAASGSTIGASALTSDNLIDLVHSVDPAYRASPRARFMFNDSTLAAIRKLKDGQQNYLWQMGDVRVGEPSQILGHPYSVNQAMANIATTNRSVIFGDFSKFVVRKVLGFQVLTLRERYAENFQVGMVGFKRFDSELLNSAAVKALVHGA